MKSPREWSADELLAIAVDRPEALFSSDARTAREELRQLNLRWHPDRNADGRASWVFSHIHELFSAAIDRLERGVWVTEQELRLRPINASEFDFRFKRRHTFELGEYFVGSDSVVYLINRQYEELVANGCRHITGLRFADGRMERELTRYLPDIAQRFETRDLLVVVLRKEAEFVVLRDLLTYAGDSLPPRHVAWIVSSLLNLLCYFEWAGLTYNGLSLDNCLVSPRSHAVALSGGWWYAAQRSSPLRALPASCADLVPPDILHRGLADARIDLEMLRGIAMQLLGIQPNFAAGAPDIPTPLMQWLSLPSAGSALVDYDDWQRVLWASFGERRFTEMAVNPEEIYAT